MAEGKRAPEYEGEAGNGGSGLQRVLGPFQLLFYSIGVIVGAGVYSVIGAAAGLAEEGLWLSFLIGAVVALLTALSYAEMATAFPKAGAEYVYLQHAVPGREWIPFAVGFIILVSGAATAATVAVAFGGYAKLFLDLPVWLSAGALLMACTAVNVVGLRHASWTNVVFTIVELAGLLLVIYVGVTAPAFGEELMPSSGAGVMAAAAVLFFVYLGFEEVANLAEEARDPGRDIPRALLLSLAITTVLYVMVALCVVALVPPAELAQSEAPLTAAVSQTSPMLARVLGAIALFATANTVLITLLASSRLAYAMGRDGELPGIFERLMPGRRSPWFAALAVLAASLALLPLGGVAVIAGLSSFAALIAFFAVNLAVVVLRFREPRRKRPFRVPLAVGRVPLPPLLAIAGILVLLVNFDPGIYLSGALALALGALSYLGRLWWRGAGDRAGA